MSTQRLFGVTGWKDSGKTTLVCKLVSEITARGYSVSTVKHAHETFEIDHEGRDSYRHRKSGASEVAISSKNRWAVIHELRGEEEASLSEMLAQLSPVDLVLIEGYKREPHPKIECRRIDARNNEDIAPNDPSIVAIARDHDIKTDLPNFDINETASIADFILDRVGLSSVKAAETSS